VRGMRHPVTFAVYELCDTGVQVTTKNGRVGVYTPQGVWLSGEKFPVDKHMCEWVGDGPREPEDLSKNRRFRSLVLKEHSL
jgi:hypothetical protein